MHLAQEPGERLRLRGTATQHRDEHRTFGVEGLLGHGGQDRRRADLDEPGHTLIGQRPDTVRETDRLPHVGDPVARVGQLISDERAGQVRYDGHLGLVERQTLSDGSELVEHRLHQRRVERVTDPQTRRLAAQLLPLGQPLLNRIQRTRDDQRQRTVHRRDRQTPLEADQRLRDLSLSRLNGNHPATSRQRTHQAATRGNQPARIGQRQNPRHMSTGQLADGVTDQDVGLHAEGLQQAEQGHLNREERRLRVLGLVKEHRFRRALRREQQFLQRPAQQPVELCTHLVQRLGEHRIDSSQTRTHPRTLRTLTREQETGLTEDRTTRHHTGARLLLSKRTQPRQQSLTIRSHHRTPLVELRP
ncbi:hypothetical protein Sxan_35940 [Streptomyces xanthophaeus]|uniref:Uncharacterized protein n=1 Tax=Streptomyces xanthophaeus TaxID=67385 RepID=A0A919GXA0_9ACTN|nr:hypothetical protein Sxan_35940 [Streptomyces xanthophaeus]